MSKQETQGQNATPQKGLGRGLSALFGEDFTKEEVGDSTNSTMISAANTQVNKVSAEDGQPTSTIEESSAPQIKGSTPLRLPIESLHPNPQQPRKIFNEEMIDALANSIAQKGMLQPILVRAKTHRDGQEGEYEIIAGERRWRAAQRVKLHEVPVSILTLSDQETIEVALIENIHRQELSAMEEAEGYQQLIERYNYTQEATSKAVGKSRSHIANLLRLLSLPEEVKAMLQDGHITMGHARALLSAKDGIKLAQKIIDQNLSVRDVERLIQNEINGKKAKPHNKAGEKTPPIKHEMQQEMDPNSRALSDNLTSKLGMAVTIMMKEDQEEGVMTISFSNLDQLDDLLIRLERNNDA